MAKGDVKKQVISKWSKPSGTGAHGLSEVVHKTEVGKNKKGKVIYRSQTKHERIS
jgi:hypothetical protein